MYVSMYTYVCIYPMYVRTYICMCMLYSPCVCMCVAYVCLYVFMYICSQWVCMYVLTYVAYICM